MIPFRFTCYCPFLICKKIFLDLSRNTMYLVYLRWEKMATTLAKRVITLGIEEDWGGGGR